MNRFVWILQIVLAVAFLGAGGTKLATPREQLAANPQMAWTQDFSDTQIRLIGTAEVLGAIGLVVPAATGILPALTIAAAVALSMLMDGATVTHVIRGEPFVVPAVLSALSMVVAAMRIMLVVRARRSGR